MLPSNNETKPNENTVLGELHIDWTNTAYTKDDMTKIGIVKRRERKVNDTRPFVNLDVMIGE
jgi:hypothetical protein